MCLTLDNIEKDFDKIFKGNEKNDELRHEYEVYATHAEKMGC